jgi:hypothetical protein
VAGTVFALTRIRPDEDSTLTTDNGGGPTRRGHRICATLWTFDVRSRRSPSSLLVMNNRSDAPCASGRSARHPVRSALREAGSLELFELQPDPAALGTLG